MCLEEIFTGEQCNCSHDLELPKLTPEQEQLLNQAAMQFGIETLRILIGAYAPVDVQRWMPLIQGAMMMAQSFGPSQQPQRQPAQSQEIKLFEW